ncbi:MAG: WecB/TagA/CpsF family glycosyltransferase [Gammaproteobacteria bacterium]|nr:WecB/TagA/CpsF family glycosyltransferase [Gammaproteobacteria bacterium]
MDFIWQRCGNLAARAAAGLLLLLTFPGWLVRIAVAFFRGGRLEWETRYGDRGAFRSLRLARAKGSGRNLWLLNIVLGQMVFVGPAAGTDPATRLSRRPGLVSPCRLRDALGISHQPDPSVDDHFFQTAGARERLTLLLRHALSGLFATPVTAGNAADAVIELFGVRIHALTMRNAVERIVSWSAATDDRPARIVSFVNPDCLNKASQDRDYHFTLGLSDLVLPDGSGLRIAAKLIGLPLHDNVNGTDLFPLLCEEAARRQQKLFLYGGRPGVAKEAAMAMLQRIPELQIAGCHDGYSHSDDEDWVIQAINASGADIVLVGLGAPRQEQWLQRSRNKLNAAVAIGVGGLFDYYSGRIRRAPIALREAGLEWVWRILQEPGEKWRRYIIGNPVFLWRVFLEHCVRRKNVNARRLEQPLPCPAELERVEPALKGRGNAQRWLITQLWQFGLTARGVAKRALDIVVSATALIALSPLLLITALAIRIESAGPVLFSQVRVGARGKTFRMVKFRSMFVDAEQRLAALAESNESADGVLFKMKQDPRITRVGRIIRRYSIDELPQILNVLRGEMSIVGPRPALPNEVSQYRPADRKRLQTKPGLTCLWQIGGRSDLSFEQQVDLDIEYLKRQNLLTDIRIIAGTVPAVVSGKGAY